VAGAVVAALVIQGAVRAAEIPGELDSSAGFARGVDEIGDLVNEGGRERLTACPPLTTNDFLTETALAWRLGVPISAFDVRLTTAPEGGTAFVASGGPETSAAAIESVGSPLAHAGAWTAYAIACQPLAREYN